MYRSREKKFQEILSLIPSSGDLRILDVGPADVEYSPFDNHFEKKYPHPQDITVLSVHPLTTFKTRYPKVRTVRYQGGAFPFHSKQFSIAISNAVIEHVGEYHEQVFFVRELNRVGRQFYLTTPAREFPWEIHTNFPMIHWLPKPLFDRLLISLGKGWAAGNYMNLLSRRRLRKVLIGAGVKIFRISVHTFGPFPLHYAVWGK